MNNQDIFNALSEHEHLLFYAMCFNPDNQAIKEAHAAAKASLEAFHKATGCINQGQAETRQVDVLKVLDEMDTFRREHQNSNQHPSDWCMRCLEAILARAAGFEGRNAWTSALRANENSQYSKDLKDSTKYFFA